MALKLLICLLLVVGVFTTIASSQENSTMPTTDPPISNSSTSDPPISNSSTTDPPTSNSSTSDPPTTTVPPITPEPPGVCASNGPCGRGSTCQERANKTFVCLCLAGDYYDETLRQCVRGKVFPGVVTYPEVYTDSMSNTASEDFKRVAEEIQNTLNDRFKSDEQYRNSTVTKISNKTATSPKTMKKAEILATVEIKFDEDSKITAAEVRTEAQTVVTFEATTLCDSNPCDITATCTETEGTFTCNCTANYIPTDFSDRLCVVACPNNQELVGDTCKPCGFGYSGLSCEDNWKQILVIVGSLLGGLLLLTIIVSTVMALKTKKKFKKGKATDYAKPSPNPAPKKTPHVSNGSAVPRPIPVQATPAGGRPGFGGNVMPRIPRATANEGWDRSNLEMVPSQSRQNLIPAGRNSRRFDEHDDPNPYSRPVKPQINPYAMGRPQVNPYASSQGHSNPYYRNDEGKHF